MGCRLLRIQLEKKRKYPVKSSLFLSDSKLSPKCEAIWRPFDNFEQNVEWVNNLEEVIKSAKSNLSPVQEYQQSLLGALLLRCQVQDWACSTGRFRHTINIFLTDKELPVKVDAAIALQMYLAPQIKEIMMELLNIFRETGDLRMTT